MKKMFQVLAVAALVLTGLAASASAQSAAVSTKVKIGFTFMAGNKQMPAGEYRIKTLSNDVSGRMILIESLDGKARAVVAGVPNPTRGTLSAGDVQFKRYGNQYFLNSVRLGDEELVHQVRKSHSERNAEQQAVKIATIQSSHGTVSIAGN